MAKVAFLGLGQMGTPMATRLVRAGHELTVWNRTPDRAKPLAAAGAIVAGSPAEAGAGAAFAITMLATPEALTEVVLGEHGLMKGFGPSQVYIDMSTVGPHTVRSIAARLPAGVAVVDAPVRGAASARPPRVASRSSSAPATKTSSACGRSSSRLVQWYTSAARAPAPA